MTQAVGAPNQAPPVNEIQRYIEDSGTIAKFTSLIGAIRRTTPERAAQLYELEKFNFQKELNEKAIYEITPISAVGCFLDVISNGLSFASGSKLVYLMSRSVKTGRKNDLGKDIYEKRLAWSASPDGKIFMAERSGAIEGASKPVIVYDGEPFQSGTDQNGRSWCTHTRVLPRPSNKIICGFIWVTRKGGQKEAFVMDVADMQRLAEYSANNNSKWVGGQRVKGDPNTLYSSFNGQPDPGFFSGKLISHALKNIRKQPIASEYQVEVEEAEVVESIDAPGPQMYIDPPHFEEPARQVERGDPGLQATQGQLSQSAPAVTPPAVTPTTVQTPTVTSAPVQAPANQPAIPITNSQPINNGASSSPAGASIPGAGDPW